MITQVEAATQAIVVALTALWSAVGSTATFTPSTPVAERRLLFQLGDRQ
jgi:hypothetical protein